MGSKRGTAGRVVARRAMWLALGAFGAFGVSESVAPASAWAADTEPATEGADLDADAKQRESRVEEAPDDGPEESGSEESGDEGSGDEGSGDERGAPIGRSDEIVVTATRRPSKLFSLPYSGRSFDDEQITQRKQARTVPEILQDTPSVLVQKTAHGQASPFLRGWTAYRNVFLIDGIRLNNSTFRSGPNQYWSTVDHLMLDRLELVLGPSSVLYGSDAIGGAVNAIPRRPESFEPGFHLGGRAYFRYASAEDSYTERLEVAGNQGPFGFLGGISMKSFGDLRAGRGSGELPNTGYDQFDADFRLEYRPGDGMEWEVAYQHSSQDDVPRTHKTVFAVPFHGTDVGSELRRDLDQQRDLVYSRWSLIEPNAIWDRASVTASFQRQTQERDRLRTGGRQDLSGFDVNTYGLQAQIERDTQAGYFTFGADFYFDQIDSFRRNYVDGTRTSTDIQGPLADDADYTTLGIYAQDEVTLFGIDWIAGLRYTYVDADADRVDNPEVPGSDPSTPGNVISIGEDFDDVSASLRGSLPVSEDEAMRVFFGLSQGFRAPTISDLTAFDATSIFEVPTEDLDPERFLQAEVGVKVDRPEYRGRLAGYWTWINDLIVVSPTGEIRDDTPVVEKDNVGDGYVAGIEAEASVRVDPDWSVYGAIGWQSGQVDQFRFPSGVKTDKPLDRLMPLSGVAGVIYEPVGTGFWIDFFTRFADDQNRLSLRDETDTERIPPGGTPGYATLNVRGGYQINERVTVSAAVENIADKDYRIHGSGQNEPGTNFITSIDFRF